MENTITMENMLNLDTQRLLSFEEVKHFFKDCNEFEITKEGTDGTIRINLKVTDTVDYEKDSRGNIIMPLKPRYTYKNYDTLVYQITVQTLIRHIVSLAYREGNDVERP